MIHYQNNFLSWVHSQYAFLRDLYNALPLTAHFLFLGGYFLNEGKVRQGSFTLPKLRLQQNYGRLFFDYKFFGTRTSKLYVKACGTTYEIDGTRATGEWQRSRDFEVSCGKGAPIKVKYYFVLHFISFDYIYFTTDTFVHSPQLIFNKRAMLQHIIKNQVIHSTK